jgi:hypothetical protein
VPARNKYREKADDCILQAELICDSRERAALLTIAQFYCRLVRRLRFLPIGPSE